MYRLLPAPRLAALTLLLLACATPVWLPAPRAAPPAGTGCLLLSPNTREDLDIDAARARIDSTEHRRYHRLAGDILGGLGVKGYRVHDALGEWEGQVENSLFVALERPIDPVTLACAAAWFGLAAQQKAVLAFHADPDGDHVLAVIDLPGRSLDDVRALLDLHGLGGRTLIVRPGGWRAIVLARAERRADLMRLPASVRVQTGRAVILGEATPDGARQRYQEAIRVYHATRPAPPVVKLGW